MQLVHHLYSPFRMAIEFQQQQHQQQQRHRTTTNAETESFVDVMGMEDVDQGTPHTERSFDLHALHTAKIPLCVLNNAQFCLFLKKYTHHAGVTPFEFRLCIDIFEIWQKKNENE